MRGVVFALPGWPKSWGLESSESSLTCLVVNGWLSTGASAGAMAKRLTRGLFMWLSHGMVAGFQGQVSQENQAEAVLHFMNCSWKSHNITSTVVKSSFLQHLPEAVASWSTVFFFSCFTLSKESL